MPNQLSTFLSLKAGIGERLRASRQQRGLKQSELAEIGGVARATQISYEAAVTEPNTAYLRAIQRSGVDLPMVLYGHSSVELDTLAIAIDWRRLQLAHEHVEFFCHRFAPQCPSSYRWQLVQKLYQDPSIGSDGQEGTERSDPITTLSEIWATYDARGAKMAG